MNLSQSKNDFYVCVRLRDEYGSGSYLVQRLGAFDINKAHSALKSAIEEYGTNHRVVIEPVEYLAGPHN